MNLPESLRTTTRTRQITHQGLPESITRLSRPLTTVHAQAERTPRLSTREPKFEAPDLKVPSVSSF